MMIEIIATWIAMAWLALMLGLVGAIIGVVIEQRQAERAKRELRWRIDRITRRKP
jgi:biopolymer transport protein ExbB/TolQ